MGVYCKNCGEQPQVSYTFYDDHYSCKTCGHSEWLTTPDPYINYDIETYSKSSLANIESYVDVDASFSVTYKICDAIYNVDTTDIAEPILSTNNVTTMIKSISPTFDKIEYCCEKCNKKFSNKTFYTRHMNRKSPCVRLKSPIVPKFIDNKPKFDNYDIEQHLSDYAFSVEI